MVNSIALGITNSFGELNCLKVIEISIGDSNIYGKYQWLLVMAMAMDNNNDYDNDNGYG